MSPSPCFAFHMKQAESSLPVQLSVRARNDMDFSLQVLSPQGIGDHDKEIWQATCLTYCQVSLTVSSLLLAASSLWLATKTNKSDSFVLWWMQKNCSQEQQEKQDRFPWLNTPHINMLIRWSCSILFYWTVKKKKQLAIHPSVRRCDVLTFMCRSMILLKKHNSVRLLYLPSPISLSRSMFSKECVSPSCSLLITVTNIAVHHYKHISTNQEWTPLLCKQPSPHDAMTPWFPRQSQPETATPVSPETSDPIVSVPLDSLLLFLSLSPFCSRHCLMVCHCYSAQQPEPWTTKHFL